ncbi:MAG: Hsp20/alpha crystallin family protein [Acidobacteriota bacterium]
MKENLGSFMELARVQSEINRLFDNLLDLRTGTSGEVSGKWVPNVDVLEGRNRLLLRFELPGVDAGQISLGVAGGDLILSGIKPQPSPGPSARLHSSDRGYGEFRRVIRLGITTNPHQATAKLKDGLLTVVLPKVANRRGEEVIVQVQEEMSADAD